MPGAPAAALPQPNPPSSLPLSSASANAISFDSLLIAGEKGVTLAVLDVDAAELKPLATHAQASASVHTGIFEKTLTLVEHAGKCDCC
jgi:hypothetical protein